MVDESRRAARRLPRAWRRRAPWRRIPATLGGLGLTLLGIAGPLAPVDAAAESLVGARVTPLAVSPQDGGKDSARPYCAVCGRPANPRIRRGDTVFCAEAHAEAFAREVAAASAAPEPRS